MLKQRKGFRERLIYLHPSLKLQLGFRAMVFMIGLVTFNAVAMVIALFAPIISPMTSNLGLKIEFNKDGLSGAELEMVNKLETRMKQLPDVPSMEQLTLAVRSSLKDFYNEDGTAKFSGAQLAELLSEGERGYRTILKKQGEEIEKLKLANTANAKPIDLRAAVGKFIDDNKDKISSMLNGRSSEGANELRFDVRAAAVMTVPNAITGHDTLPDELIESFSVAKFVEVRQPREYVFDMANRTTVAKVTEFKTWLEEGSAEGDFAIVAEGGLKPLMDYDLVRNSSTVAKAAGKQVYTEEFRKFRAEAYAIIRRLINNKVLRDYAAILTTRLRADAVAYTSSALDGQYANPTDYHAIGAVAAQIEALNFVPDLLIMNPQDKWRIGLQQATDGHFYIQIPITDPRGQVRIMGLAVRTSNRLAAGEFILGESGLWEIEDEPLSVRIGYGAQVTGGTSNGGGNVTDVQMDIDHNRFRIIVETFFHSFIATPNIGSFVLAEYDEVKALLQSA